MLEWAGFHVLLVAQWTCHHVPPSGCYGIQCKAYCGGVAAGSYAEIYMSDDAVNTNHGKMDYGYQGTAKLDMAGNALVHADAWIDFGINEGTATVTMSGGTMRMGVL